MSSETSIHTHGIVYHSVQQRSEEWLGLRRLGGSQIGAAAGLSMYESPMQFVEDFHKPFSGSMKAVEHGTKMEPTTDRLFRSWLSGDTVQKAFNDTCDFRPSSSMVEAWKNQVASEEPGYLTLDPTVKHKVFTHSMSDYRYFGGSLDYEGSVIDAEYKNPFRYYSFYTNYMNTIKCEYFAQVQWLMALRGREAMFFVATSIDPDTGTVLAVAIWYVRFSRKFFEKMLYPAGLVCAKIVYDNDDPQNAAKIPWLNEKGVYQKSPEYKKLLRKYACRIYLRKDGAAISAMIKAQRAATSDPDRKHK